MNEKLMALVDRWVDIDEPNWRNDDQLVVEPYIKANMRDTRFYGGASRWYVRYLKQYIEDPDSDIKCDVDGGNVDCEAMYLSIEERLTHPIIDIQITQQILDEFMEDVMNLAHEIWEVDRLLEYPL